MKEKYVTPEIEWYVLMQEDIVRTSNVEEEWETPIMPASIS